MAKDKEQEVGSHIKFALYCIDGLRMSALATIIRLPFRSPFIAVLGAIGFILGLISIFKNEDRSLFVLLSIPVGLLIIFWVVAEIAFPH